MYAWVFGWRAVYWNGSCLYCQQVSYRSRQRMTKKWRRHIRDTYVYIVTGRYCGGRIVGELETCEGKRMYTFFCVRTGRWSKNAETDWRRRRKRTETGNFKIFQHRTVCLSKRKTHEFQDRFCYDLYGLGRFPSRCICGIRPISKYIVTKNFKKSELHVTRDDFQ